MNTDETIALAKEIISKLEPLKKDINQILYESDHNSYEAEEALFNLEELVKYMQDIANQEDHSCLEDDE